jgi:hypothetical protein
LTDTDTAHSRDYFRRDQRDGISPPDLSKECTYAEHIVHARGKRTQFTSVSLDLAKIWDLGESSYKLEQQSILDHGHELIEHGLLLDELSKVVRDGEKAERLRAVQARRYATRRKEGLIDWSFDTKGVARKDLINWAQTRIQGFFTRLHR